MDKVFAEHADFEHLHLETCYVSRKWEWRVFDMKTKVQLASGTADSLEHAKEAAEIKAGVKPDWRVIGPEIDTKPAT